jgi:integrase
LAKPTKPYPDFPLFPHATGRWAKKIRGKLHYFGPWSDPDGALQRYLAQRDALHSGKPVQPDAEAVTLRDLANHYLNHKEALLDNGELSPRTWADYQLTATLVVNEFGKHTLVSSLSPSDFAALRKQMAKTWGPVRLGDFIARVRGMFRYGVEASLIDRMPLFGPGFQKPSRKTLRLERAKKGSRIFTAAEIQQMLSAANVPLKTMILLALNCGLGNADIGRLREGNLDLQRGWLDFPRPKTGIGRRCPLWSETITAIRTMLSVRPPAKDPGNADLVFLSKAGTSFYADAGNSPITQLFGRLLKRLGINGQRGFYSLRHTHATIGGEARDQAAVSAILGHVVTSMTGNYQHGISDDRLIAVVDCVHSWLFGPQQPTSA